METKERKHDMHKVDRDILVSATDRLKSKEEQEEYNKWHDKQEKEKEKEIVEDLDNQHCSEGEKYDE